MTVAELITILQTMSPSADVVIPQAEEVSPDVWDRPIETVEFDESNAVVKLFIPFPL